MEQTAAADLRRQFDEDGYIVVPGLLSSEEVSLYRAQLQQRSGIDDSGADPDPDRRREWNLGDGVTTEPTFWPVIFHARLLEHIRAILGPTARYTQHSDLHVNRGLPGWHRDSANREFAVGRDWDESRARYRVVRVAIYLQSFAESGSRLGVIPASHRREPPLALTQRRLTHRFGRLRRGEARGATAPFLWPRPVWIATEPGDCVIFSQRLLHSASPLRGPKYALFLSYGEDNEHSRNHRRYYMFERPDIGYKDYPEDLAQRLREEDLYLEIKEPDPARTVSA